MWLEAEKARNFNAVVWVLGEVNGYHYVDLFFNLLSDKSTDRRADITHSVMAVLRKDFIGFTRLPCTSDCVKKGFSGGRTCRSILEFPRTTAAKSRKACRACWRTPIRSISRRTASTGTSSARCSTRCI